MSENEVKMLCANSIVTAISAGRKSKDGVEKTPSQHEATVVFMSNGERNSLNAVVRYVGDKGDVVFGVVPMERLILENIVAVDSGMLESMKAEVSADLGSMPKSVIVFFLSHQLENIKEILGWKDYLRTRTPWPEGVNWVRFAKNSISLEALKEAGFTPLLLRELISSGIIAKVSATE